MALSWIGLVAGLVAAGHTDDAFENALAEALGPSWRDTIDPVMSAHPSGIKWTRMFSALRFKRRGAVVRTRDVQYVDDGSRRHRLDVWRRDGVGPAAPVLLQIHGGGWMIGVRYASGDPAKWQRRGGEVCAARRGRASDDGSGVSQPAG